MTAGTPAIPGYGICIYCKQVPKPNETLDKEHVIPLALDGRLVIKKASCADCAKIIHRYETKVMQHLLLPLMLHNKTKSRKKTRRTSFDGIKVIDDVSEQVIVDIKSLAWLAFPPVLMPPRYFLGLAPNYHASTWHTHTVIPNRDFVTRNGTKRYNLKVRAYNDVTEFCQIIAKIAYCSVVASYGLHSFTPVILPTVLSGVADYNYYVGKPFKPNEQKGSFLNLGETKHHKVLILERHHRGEILLTCVVSLFANHDFPAYEAVVGVLKDKGQRKAL